MFPGFGVGGAQARFCAVANHHGRALRHAIVAMDGQVACRERLDPGLDVQLLGAGLSKGNPAGMIRRLRALLRELRPDVMLTHNWGSIDWAVANAMPFTRTLVRHVHVEDGFGPEERDRQLGRRVLARRLALRGTVVALPSLVLLRLAETVWRLDRRRLRYVPNGVDLARFAPAPTGPAPWALAGEGPVVGTVAALRPEKNLGRLLHALAHAPGLRLAIIGDGPERPALQKLAAALGVAERVAFVGHLSDPAGAYAHMDLFALSSDTEQMPLSVLEAMAAGLPVAATAVGDVAAMLAAENAPFVVPRDAGALGAALGQLGAEDGLRRSIGAANRAKAARDYGQAAMFATWGGLLGAAPPSA